MGRTDGAIIVGLICPKNEKFLLDSPKIAFLVASFWVQSHKRILKAVLLILALIGLLLVWRYIVPFEYKNPPEAPTAPQNSTLGGTYLIQGNTLGVIVSPLPQYQTELWEVAQELNYDYDKLYALWRCEDSKLKHDGIFGDSGLAYGAFQYWDNTWYRYNQKFGLKLNKLLFKDQARLTIMILKESGGWQNWFNCLDKYF